MPKYGLLQKPCKHLLLLDIIHQKPLQVNHQRDAQPENQKREAFWTPRFALNYAFADAPVCVIYSTATLSYAS